MRMGEIGKIAAEIGKCVGIALLFSLIAELVFALVIQLCSLSESVVMPVNQAIKAVAIVLGCLLGFSAEKGIVKGAAGGVLVIAVTWLAFSFIAGGVSVSKLFPLELFFGAVVGAIAGVIAVNVKK